jgi:hypothetical protein
MINIGNKIYSRVRIMLATLSFVLWASFYMEGADLSNAFWEGLTAFLVFLIFVYTYKYFDTLEVFYMGLFLIYLTKYLTNGYEYFFFMLMGMLIYGKFVYNEYRKYNR